MKHRSIRELFDYWNIRRGCRPAPERDEIEPGAIRRALADTFILGHRPHDGHRFRIAGTRVCALFGRELKDRPLLELCSASAQAEIDALVTIVTQETIGVLVGVSGATAPSAEAPTGSPLELELLLLPLAYRGRMDARLIGALAPRSSPYWLGTHAIGHLMLGSYRYVGHASAAPLPAFTPAIAPVQPRLVVHDGGRA